MSKKLYEETNIQGIAAAIREKNGTQNTYTTSQMASAIRAITTQPNLETLSVNQNGKYFPSAGKDGFSEVNVNVQGGLPILQEKTARSNGIILPDAGYDGLSKVTVNVESGSSDKYLSYDWDFRESLIDSISDVQAECHSVTYDENGLLFNKAYAYVTLPPYVKSFAVAKIKPLEIELDVGDMNLATTSGHKRFVMTSEESGLIYRSTGVWSFYADSYWAQDSDISDKDYFSNSLLKIIIDSNDYWHIYKNNDLVYEPNRRLAFDLDSQRILGASNASCNGVLIKGLRIHAAQGS